MSEATTALLAARTADAHWEGRLSSSALSTATAVTALAVVAREASPSQRADGAAVVAGYPTIERVRSQMAAGLTWLAAHANADGGWGDTVLSLSNLSTTALCWAAFRAVPGARETYRAVVDAAESWLRGRAGGIEPDRLSRAIIARYGKDRTFSVPILTLCALAGCLGAGRAAWRHVIPLRFELAACPHRCFAALRLQVVSYALPALIAIGQARHYHAPSLNPFVRLLRSLTRPATLRKLRAIQPAHGGFLEATPLTSFVVMSLAGSGQGDHPVTRQGLAFLTRSMRADGSWPIDTNLATWLTTLAVNALGGSAALPPAQDGPLRAWLVGQQYRRLHPYTQAAPGGWAWTDLPGGVPDADDTSGAVLALFQLGEPDATATAAALMGVAWLLRLQNRDGGIPTFCRGWGALPFDRSSADITAHAIRAWLAWQPRLPQPWPARLDRGLARAARFLCRAQRPGGEWVPLWFGNQFATGDENPTYGTTRVLVALAELLTTTPRPAQLQKMQGSLIAALGQATSWLIGAQNRDGSWGGQAGVQGSTEETALAVEALSCLRRRLGAPPGVTPEALEQAWQSGVDWLVARVESGQWKNPAPIGFYFANLWYYDELYPLIFTAAALRQAQEAAAAGISHKRSD